MVGEARSVLTRTGVTDREEPTKLGTVLRTAREARFIDLARVERDHQDPGAVSLRPRARRYRDLPEPIYTPAFLRNYGRAVPQALDPEY